MIAFVVIFGAQVYGSEDNVKNAVREYSPPEQGLRRLCQIQWSGYSQVREYSPPEQGLRLIDFDYWLKIIWSESIVHQNKD